MGQRFAKVSLSAFCGVTRKPFSPDNATADCGMGGNREGGLSGQRGAPSPPARHHEHGSGDLGAVPTARPTIAMHCGPLQFPRPAASLAGPTCASF